MKQLAVAGEHEKINAVINMLNVDLTYSPQANHRKVGCVGFFFFFLAQKKFKMYFCSLLRCYKTLLLFYLIFNARCLLKCRVD